MAASKHFSSLQYAFCELQRIYLPSDLARSLYTPDEQEFARSFAVMLHAEIEHYIELSCTDVAKKIINASKSGQFFPASISFLFFSRLPPLNGGDKLGKKDGISRKITTRLYDANVKYEELINANEGIREKHLAKLLVPLSLSADNVDPTWLSEIDTLATFRGAFAHMSRNSNEASIAKVNPVDILQLCNRIVNGDPRLKRPGVISSLQELDEWLYQLDSAPTVTYIATNESLLARLWSGAQQCWLKVLK